MRILLCFLCSFYWISSVATIQQKDILIYNGEPYELRDFYLEPYFEAYPDKKPISGIVSSDLWRGYVAVFTISNGHLHLIDLLIKVQGDTIFERKWVSVFQDLSPNCDEFPAYWVDDLEILPIGDVVDYQPGFGVSFSNYELLEFRKGELIYTKQFGLNVLKTHFSKCHYFLKEEDLIVMQEKLSH